MSQQETARPGRLRITLVRSVIGHPQRQRANVHALGLRRIRHTVEHDDSPVIRGMIAQVHHLVRVEQVAEGERTERQETGTQRFQAKVAKRKALREEWLRMLDLLNEDEDTASEADDKPAAAAAGTAGQE